MEVQLAPGDQARLAALVRRLGCAEGELIREVVGGYLDDVEDTREMLDHRLDDVESGRVKPLAPEQLWESLARRKDAFLRKRS